MLPGDLDVFQHSNRCVHREARRTVAVNHPEQVTGSSFANMPNLWFWVCFIDSFLHWSYPRWFHRFAVSSHSLLTRNVWKR